MSSSSPSASPPPPPLPPPQTFLDALSQAISKQFNRVVTLKLTQGGTGGVSGGGGASTCVVCDDTSAAAAAAATHGNKFFVKSARNGLNMLRGEYRGVQEMYHTHTIRVPKPVALGEYQSTAFAIFEYLEFTSEQQGGGGGGGGDGHGKRRGGQYELGQKLAQMHRHTSNEGFGFHCDNTIGATFQPNTWTASWPDFWDTYRLGHMLRLTNDAGLTFEKAQQLRTKTRELLSHNPAPSLLHGDLWGGNKGFVKDKDNINNGGSVPCIFDPATYYGDREADVAMTSLFGGFSSDFYKGYNDEWPLPQGHEKRIVVYNLYHILNHDVLFGGGYLSQARSMIEQILRS